MSADDLFSMENLAVFERHGAKVTNRAKVTDRERRHGAWIHLPNGWVLSVQWGGCTYSSNYDERAGSDVPPATSAEIAAWRKGADQGLVTWEDGDTVKGWCTMARVQHVLDLLAADELLQQHDTTEMRAIDGWQEAAT